MKAKLTDKHYEAYIMLYFDESSEEDVAKFMGYKVSDTNRKIGYRQVKNLKNKFHKMAIEIMRKEKEDE